MCHEWQKLLNVMINEFGSIMMDLKSINVMIKEED
jgi:hypothetical protein